MLLTIIGSFASAFIVGWLAMEAGYDPISILLWLIAAWACNVALILGSR